MEIGTRYKGGGRVSLDHEEKRILLYGISADFNDAKKEDIIKALPDHYFSGSLHGYKVMYSPPNILDLGKAWEAAEEIYIVPD